MPRRVFITRAMPEPGPSLVAEAAEVVDANDEDRGLSRDELLAAVPGHEAIFCTLTDRIDDEVLEAARDCRVVANLAVGFDNIDVAAATRRGIWVTNTPGALTDATADLAWALILAVARGVVGGDAEVREGRFLGWGPLYRLGGDVTGATLGLVGPGRIAQAVARRAVGFRMPLLYHGRRPSPELDEMGARQVDLHELLAQSDFVSLHTPLTPETRHLIDEKALAAMKPSAYLINTARGPVVDEAALVKALRIGRIAGAGLDVFEREPALADGLAACPNAVLLPHLGSATRATRSSMARIAAANVVAVLRGEIPPNPVNPEVQETHPRNRAEASPL